MTFYQSSCNVVVLANSIKKKERCVAVKRLDNKEWIRPVANIKGAELTRSQASAKNPFGRYPVKPLQKVYMGFSAVAPLEHQPENRVIDRSEWKQNYKIEQAELVQFLDYPDSLWGRGDRVSYYAIKTGHITIEQSLQLIQVENLQLYIRDTNRPRASFTYNGINYDLAVTAPNFNDVCDDQSALMGILCISLGEEFHGDCYKLVAAIY